jgi:hypothetical protein
MIIKVDFIETFFMLKNKMLFVSFTLMASSFTLFSCDNYLDVNLPISQLTSDKIFQDNATANAAMANVYAKMRTSGLFAGGSNAMPCLMGWYTDELEYYQQSTPNNFYNNTLFEGEVRITDIWNQSFNQIYTANRIIEGLDLQGSSAVKDKNQLKGEALFVRAFIHSMLLNTFGAIPYVTSTDYTINKTIRRLAPEEVYEKIIADLNLAKGLLTYDYISADRTRPNRSVAEALLARIYLYTENYPEAANAASAVINNPIYKWEFNLDKVFLKGSTTTIWQFAPNLAGANTTEGNLFIFTVGPPALVGLRNDFINSFEADDKRKMLWTTRITNGSSSWYYASKYKQASNTSTSLEYSIILRLAEQYLIRAEARAYQGDLIGAKEDLDLIRTTAGLSHTEAGSGKEITDDVLNQRRFELFTESGHRFFDLKRTGKLNEVLSAVKPGWNSEDALWPIPLLELNANPNLKPQNPGY